MGRKPRHINSGTVLIRQKGAFFQNQSEQDIYVNILFSHCEAYKTVLLGYLLHYSSVTLFLETQDASKFMQVVNSSFIRHRNKARQEKIKSDIKRYEIREILINEFNNVLSFLSLSGGYVFKNANGELSLSKKIEIEKFNKRKDKRMKIVALNAKEHADLSYHSDVIPNMPFCEILAAESLFCESSLPIVFTNDVVPKTIALLGREKNVIINDSYTGYVPVSIKNYPFSLANVDDKNVLCIDEDAPHFQGEGNKLFVDGKPSEFLEYSINVMKKFNDELAITNAMAEEIKKSGILITKELTVNIDDKKATLLKGFSIISKKKLNELSDETLAMFVRRGYIDFINSHLRSLNNLELLASRILENE